MERRNFIKTIILFLTSLFISKKGIASTPEEAEFPTNPSSDILKQAVLSAKHYDISYARATPTEKGGTPLPYQKRILNKVILEKVNK